MRRVPGLLTAVLGVIGAMALSTDEWRKQSIYQVLTDRFARTDGSTSSCSNLRSYCGGTWRGLTQKLNCTLRSSIASEKCSSQSYAVGVGVKLRIRHADFGTQIFKIWVSQPYGLAPS
jgi:hypothetical protein